MPSEFRSRVLERWRRLKSRSDSTHEAALMTIVSTHPSLNVRSEDNKLVLEREAPSGTFLSTQSESEPQPSSSTSRPDAISESYGPKVVFEGTEPIVDIVAVHGLNGHREKTWTAKVGSNRVNWLRDLLPADIPDARVIAWGYDAHTHSKSRLSCQSLCDHARTLVSDLYLLRARTNSIKRPIIFVAHSLGGIVVKSALIHSDASRRGALEHHRSIKVSTHGIIFMGTPHQGGNNVALGQLLTRIASIFTEADDRILQHLRKDSEWLQQQLVQFGPISAEFVTKFAYEEYETITKLGHKMMVVPRSSAVVPGQADAEPIVIHADHIHMVKFASRDDNGYEKISGHLQLMAAEAGDQIRSRWEMEARVDEVRNDFEPHAFSLPFSLSEVTETTRFVGRQDELLKLHRELDATQGRRVVILHGLGGIGKTQLTIAYLKSYRASYSAIIWLNARDETSLEQSFDRAAKRILRHYPSLDSIRTALEDQEPQGIVQAVKQWLDEPRNDRWLLVFDNYDNPKLGNEHQSEDDGEDTKSRTEGGSLSSAETEALKPFDVRLFFPDSYQGSIIITTRCSITSIGSSIFLKKLTNINDGLEILSSTSHRQDLANDEAAIEIARRLDGLPLALATAGAYLNQVSTSCTDYLDMYQTSWLRLQQTSPSLLSYENRALYSTWDISYRQIERKNPAAAMLLKLWAYLNKEDLWYELLQDDDPEAPAWFAAMTQDRISFDEVMRVLCDHGLVEVDSREPAVESQGYSLHECVHSWMISVLNMEQDATMARQARICVALHIPTADKPGYWQVQRRLLLHADICAAHVSRLVHVVDWHDGWALGQIANLYLDQGRHKAAEEIYDRLFKDFEKGWGPEHVSTLGTANNLGNLYADQGRLEEAEMTYSRAIQSCEKALEPDHPLLLSTINNLGLLYLDQGRYREAEEMLDRALQRREKALGLKHASTLNTVLTLGNLYFHQGLHKDAEAMYTRALHGREKTSGLEHASTLDTVQNLGSLYKFQGRHKEAEAMYTRALQGREKAFGLEHASTLRTVYHLGNLYFLQGWHQKAEVIYNRALEGYERSLGSAVRTHVPALNTMERLGWLCYTRSDLEQARILYARALDGVETVFGREDEQYCRLVSALREVCPSVSEDALLDLAVSEGVAEEHHQSESC